MTSTTKTSSLKSARFNARDMRQSLSRKYSLRWQSVRLFYAGWVASQTGSVAQNGETCACESDLTVQLLNMALDMPHPIVTKTYG